MLMNSKLMSVLALLALIPGLALAGNTKDQQAQEEAQKGPQEDVTEAAEVMEQMRQEGELAAQLQEAKAVFVVPDYAAASLLVGGSGGEGVLIRNADGEWSSPAFYDVGSLDIGAQAGASAGSIALLLMTDEAVDNFRKDSDFALTSQAGLTIVNWSASTGASMREGDVIFWSDLEGLQAQASVGVSGIRWDDEENREYYESEVSAEQVLAGTVENPHEEVMRSEFAAFSTHQ